MREGAMEGSERGLFCQDCSGGISRIEEERREEDF
jgi:hypothetical protein